MNAALVLILGGVFIAAQTLRGGALDHILGTSSSSGGGIGGIIPIPGVSGAPGPITGIPGLPVSSTSADVAHLLPGSTPASLNGLGPLMAASQNGGG